MKLKRLIAVSPDIGRSDEIFFRTRTVRHSLLTYTVDATQFQTNRVLLYRQDYFTE
jgi:hypothetical protein